MPQEDEHRLLVRRHEVHLQASHYLFRFGLGLNLASYLNTELVVRDCLAESISEGEGWTTPKKSLEEPEGRRLCCHLSTDHETQTDSNALGEHPNVELDLVLVPTHIEHVPVLTFPSSRAEDQTVLAPHLRAPCEAMPEEVEFEFAELGKRAPQSLDLGRERLRALFLADEFDLLEVR